MRRFVAARRNQSGEIKSYKDYFVAVPFFLTTGALTFDVGYFAGIDLNFFTLFSLSEHVLFALEALPIVFTIAFLATCSWFVMFRSGNKIEEPSAAQWLEVLSRKWELPRLLLSLCFFAAPAVISALFGVTPVVVVVAIVSIFLGSAIAVPQLLSDQRAKLLLALVFSLSSIFALGLIVARLYVQDEEIDHQLRTADGVFQGKVIRSGERGMLFVDVLTHRIRFFKWDDIKDLNTVKLLPHFR